MIIEIYNTEQLSNIVIKFSILQCEYKIIQPSEFHEQNVK